MSTSDKRLLKTALIYAWVSSFFAFFGAVYEVFSHQVYSYFMIYAFAIPLGMGVIPFLILALGKGKLPGPWALRFYHSGVAALTAGCIFEGVLRIYGTTNRLLLLYPVCALALLLLAAALFAIERRRTKNAA